MKSISLLLCALLLLSSTAFAADVTGTWQITLTAPGPDRRQDTGLAVLKQEGNTITGTVGPDANRQNPIAEGTIKDNKITLKVASGSDRTMTFEITVNGDQLTGTVERTGSPEKLTVEFVKAAQK
jgi:hypothetical protein